MKNFKFQLLLSVTVSQNNWENSMTSYENNNKRLFRPIIFHGSSVYAFDLDQSKPVVSIARLNILSCQVFTWIWKCKQKQNKPAIQLAIWQTKPCQAKIKIAENCVNVISFNTWTFEKPEERFLVNKCHLRLSR